MASTRPRRPSSRLLLHPLPLAAVFLLLCNDHALKAWWPGVVTGKLSDIAGMVYFPLFLFALAAPLAPPSVKAEQRVLTACTGATGLVFALIKALPAATEAYRRGLGFLQWPWWAALAARNHQEVPGIIPVHAVTDPTDLIALPFLLVPFLLGRKLIHA